MNKQALKKWVGWLRSTRLVQLKCGFFAKQGRSQQIESACALGVFLYEGGYYMDLNQPLIKIIEPVFKETELSYDLLIHIMLLNDGFDWSLWDISMLLEAIINDEISVYEAMRIKTTEDAKNLIKKSKNKEVATCGDQKRSKCIMHS